MTEIPIWLGLIALVLVVMAVIGGTVYYTLKFFILVRHQKHPQDKGNKENGTD